jgi:hypothetical protein
MRRISQASLSIVGRMQAPRNYYKSTKKIDAEKMLCKRRDGYTNATERERERERDLDQQEKMESVN